MNQLVWIGVAAVALFANGSAAAKTPPVRISDARIRDTREGQSVTIGFVSLRAATDAVLIAVSTPVAKSIQLHEMKREPQADGSTVVRMSAVARIDLPAGQEVKLRAGDMHLMLFGLKHPLHQGDAVPLTLLFEIVKTKRRIAETLTASVIREGVQVDAD